MKIFISLPAQTLELFAEDLLLRRYVVSTAKNGAGETHGSYQTPRGRHLIRAKIGAGCAENTVFVGRRPTGEIWTPELAALHPGRDWMLSRILWLSGREPGVNRLGSVDTMRRYIYLHGSPDRVAMGTPGSIGCVRMRNSDIVELFDLVPVFTAVNIGEFKIVSCDWPAAMAGARQVRDEVFIGEQGVAKEIEWDERDASASHVLALDATGNAIGCARLLDDGHIGRMAVLAGWRGKGVGRALLSRLLEMACGAGRRLLMLSAQRHAVAFYTRFGFVPEGEEFREADIPHLRMRRDLPA